jgi:hypothetical protein
MLANALERSFDYTNTYYHQEPRLDICGPAAGWTGSAEFLISSDVFEHVSRPVQAAFDGAANVLADGGLLVLTVPFDDRPATTEHFPPLHHHKIVEVNGEWILINCTVDGAIDVYRELNFHGGPGTTLEMRFFALTAVIAHLEAAGFEDITVHDEQVPQWGIFPPHNQGLPISARKRAIARKRRWF